MESIINSEQIKIAFFDAKTYDIDLQATFNKIHVLRVPEYSPHAVAEHTAALILALNRKVHRAYNRIRDNNFSIAGLMGFANLFVTLEMS